MANNQTFVFTPPPPDERPLVEQVETIWKRGLHQLPVYKDFPRLAGGFEIVNGNTKKIIFKERDSSSRAIACRDIITKLALFFPDAQKPLKTPKRKRRKTASKRNDTHEEKEVGEPDDDDSDREFEPTPIPAVDYTAEDEQELSCDDDDDSIPPKPAPMEKTISQNSVSYSLMNNDGKQPGESFADLILLHYAEHVRDIGGDLSVQINHFLRCGAIDEEGKLAKILKCVQQEIICPAVMDLRTTVYPKFPYKDIKGTWYVRVELYFEEKRKRSRSGSKSSVISGSLSGSDLKSGQIIPSPSPKPRRRRKKSLSGNKASILGSRTSGDETSSSTVSPKAKKEKSRSIPDFVAARTNSLSSIDLPTRRSKVERTKTSPGRQARSEMSSLRSSVHQTIGINVSSDEEENRPVTPKDIDETSILELAKMPFSKIRVLHRKRERSNIPNVIPDASNPEAFCEFEWELAMTFDATMEHLTEATLRIIDVATPEDISVEKRGELLSAISPFTSHNFPYIIVWKSINRHVMYKELPQLCNICEIMDGKGNKLYEPSTSKTCLSTILLCLAVQLGDSGALTSEILHSLDQKGSSSSHNTKNVKNLIGGLREDDPGHKKMLNIIRATSQDMQSPTLSRFRYLLSSQVKEIKPVKGSRRVVIVFTDSEIRVSQYQRLTCQLSDSSDFFVFACVDHICYSTSMDHIDSVNVEIIEHSFSPKILEARKQQIKQTLKVYLTANTIESKTSTISIENAIQCLANALSQLPPSDQIVTDPDLPGGKMSSLNLLDLLRQTLPEGFPALTFTELTHGSSEED